MPSLFASSLISLVVASSVSAGPLLVGGGLNGISSACINALTGIRQNENSAETSCLNVNGLLNILQTPPDQSIIPAITNFIQPFCSAESCSNSTLQSTLPGISAACGSALGSTVAQSLQNGVDLSLNSWLVGSFQPTRDALCLFDTNNDNNQNCVIETLTNFQTVIGENLSLNDLLSLPVDLLTGRVTLPQSASSLLCTDCMRALSRTARGTLFLPEQADELFLRVCNASFIVGAPQGIVTEITGVTATAGVITALPTGAGIGAGPSINSVFTATIATQAPNPTAAIPSGLDPSLASATVADGATSASAGLDLQTSGASPPFTGGAVRGLDMGTVWTGAVLTMGILFGGLLV